MKMMSVVVFIGLAATIAFCQPSDHVLESFAAKKLCGGDSIIVGWSFVDNDGDGVRDGMAGTLVTMADVRAHTNDADVVAAALAAVDCDYPTPEAIVPLFDGTNQLGTASLYVDAETMAVYAATNTASPRRTASQQAADRAARKAAIDAAKAKPNGNLQQRIERLEAIIAVLTGGAP